ncbi:hypothetical protein COK18_07950 [Bacillus cereus]|uniref:hypothetical protein n=1 Tax=Bacillus cereus TaxID=1396 RepID=UPI000BFA06E1|nr:hypothetical protein [Bacillus cereus]PFQ65904.1 hypothetical protein COK18_07950 [Bacillus cereus]
MEITPKMIRDVQKKRAIYARMMKTLATVNKERFGKEVLCHLEMDPDKIKEAFEEVIQDGAVIRITIKMAKSLLESTLDEKIVLGCLKHVAEEPEKILRQAKKRIRRSEKDLACILDLFIYGFF